MIYSFEIARVSPAVRDSRSWPSCSNALALIHRRQVARARGRMDEVYSSYRYSILYSQAHMPKMRCNKSGSIGAHGIRVAEFQMNTSYTGNAF